MKKKITAICLVVAMAAIAITGATLAYFTDTKTATNTFTVGNVAITLDEAQVTRTVNKDTGLTTWTAADERVTGNDYGAVYPGAVLPKDPTVHNTGANPCYVRIKVAGLTADAAINDLGANWVKDEDVDTNGNGYYYYNGILKNGESTSALFTELQISTDVTDASSAGEITLTADAIQADSFTDYADAFAAFDKK